MTYSNASRSAYNNGKNSNSNKNEVAIADTVTRHLVSLEKDFISAAAWNPSLSFAKECVFAKHVINNSPYLTELASRNLKSFEVAFLQLATSGLTLDPAQKMAYLVPRMGRVFLDVSYIGLSRMATDEGLCEDIVVELVFERDNFKSNGRRKSPEHSFDPFADKGDLILTSLDKGQTGDRGKFRGAYVDYLMKDNRNLVYFITKEELAAARAVSESWKKAEEREKSPWFRFPWAMVRKSAIKQTIHQIPGNRTRTSSIIEYLNKDGGEGFRDVSASPLQSAEFEMSARRTAHHHSQPAPSGNIYDGELVNDDMSQKPNPQQHEEPVKSDENSNAQPQSLKQEAREKMSDIPGVRFDAKRRINQLTKRVERTRAYETMLADVRTSFEFNEAEINFAVRCLEQSRRNLLQNQLTEAVIKCDFTELDKFLNELPEGDFKEKSTLFVQTVQEQTSKMRSLYDEALKTNNFTQLEEALTSITFDPLKKVLTDMLNAAKAA
ncbi:recombinase RecT [Cronobacter turicensis]